LEEISSEELMDWLALDALEREEKEWQEQKQGLS
jgi:hypothetical protein